MEMNEAFNLVAITLLDARVLPFDADAVAALIDNAFAGGASGISLFSVDGMDPAKWQIVKKRMAISR